MTLKDWNLNLSNKLAKHSDYILLSNNLESQVVESGKFCPYNLTYIIMGGYGKTNPNPKIWI